MCRFQKSVDASSLGCMVPHKIAQTSIAHGFIHYDPMIDPVTKVSHTNLNIIDKPIDDFPIGPAALGKGGNEV